MNACAKISGCLAFITYLISPLLSAAGMNDDPLLFKVMIDQLEMRMTEGNDPLVADIQSWVGKDLHKLWLKGEIERVGSETEKAELQLFYSRAIDTYWDVQIGVRQDFRPKPQRTWFALGLKGLAPYWFEVDGTVFIGENGQTAVRLETEYELLFSQQWVLSPEFEINFHGKNDEATGIGRGLSDIELGLRLRYQVRREFAPYIGINWTKKFGKTADFARDGGDTLDDVQGVFGVSVWF